MKELMVSPDRKMEERASTASIKIRVPMFRK
jgi:hypothetical protein